MSAVSVIIPVRDGARYLQEVLDAVREQGPDEVLVIDSGSGDGSREIAAAAEGVELLEIEPGRFGHGRTRNLGAERTTGELICFLTQDATPLPGWLDAYREAFGLGERVGAAFGPHLPRPGTSPMIARELTEFFAGFAPDGRPALQRAGDVTFLSNVNACYTRACWREIGFRDVDYSEDQAFGADLLDAGWAKAYHPGAAVLHAHDYPWRDFMRRYFDEYRGLSEATGHVEPFSPAAAVREVRGQVDRDVAWMRSQGWPPERIAAWAARAAAHHAGRRAFSAAGSRAQRLPAPVRRALSLEGRSDRPAVPTARSRPPAVTAEPFEPVARLMRDGPAPLAEPLPGMSDAERLHVALIVPPFARGSGGHNTLFQLASRLERRGHLCSIWLHDPHGLQRHAEWPAVVREKVNSYFAPFPGPVFEGFERWYGADVAIATGWETAHATMLLGACRARAYVVNDHEPEFFGTSPERRWAEDTYRLGMYCIAASPWLRDLLAERYGARGTDFELGVDHELYSPRDVSRRRDTIICYARGGTPRRGVPLAMLALAELHRRRPEVRIVLFGDDRHHLTSLPHEDLGIVDQRELSWAYSEATVGLTLSLTNFSLIPKEMLACGLPCVEVAGVSAESIFGADGPLELAAPEPLALADAMERLLDDPGLWERRSRAGVEYVASHTWERATDQVEAALRAALREREPATVA